MKILGRNINFRTSQQTWQQKASKALIDVNSINDLPEKNASSNVQYFPTTNRKFDGEKTPGELGYPVEFTPEYQGIALRSWEAYLKSDIAQILVNRLITWVVGAGLKLQAEPEDKIINAEGFNFDKAVFTSDIERRFGLYGKNRICDYAKRRTLAGLAKIVKKHSILGGDVLCVIRTGRHGPNIQLIDGIDICTPWIAKYTKKEGGNEIIHGVEVNKSGRQIAYHVINKDGMSWTRIPAVGERTRRLQAFLIYGNDYRVDDVRGLPILSAILEKIKKLDRYTEATVGGAEERAKIPIYVEHGVNSTGQNPMINSLKLAANAGEENLPEGKYGTIEDTSKKVAMTTGKTLINLPIDSSLKALESKQETNFGEFMDKNFTYLAASLNIPVEIALMLFQNNFSSSRMAGKMWETILDIQRAELTTDFYKPFYNIFLELEILKDKVQADGYFSALNSGDIILMEAYQNCRFTGPKVPHVDPIKEAKAEIEKLKEGLTTREKATEDLGGGDFAQNQERLKEEENIRFKPEPQEPTDPNNEAD